MSVVYAEKKVSTTEPAWEYDAAQLTALIAELEAVGGTPPVPGPETFNKQLLAMIRKMYESGAKQFQSDKIPEALRLFEVGLEMAVRRARFEPFRILVADMSMFLMLRADLNLKAQNYLAAFNDADLLVAFTPSVPDNHLRRGVANYFLGNFEAARVDYQRGLAFDPTNARLKAELEVVERRLLEENGEA